MKSKSILLVEDNIKLANYLKESLQEAGYAVSIEKRGDRAVYRILREQPSVVILDIMLPGMNGDQICDTIRDDYLGKILMLTAINDIESEVSSLNLGADDYLTKPVADEVLKSKNRSIVTET
ncbi:two component system DNA-binding response regulator [Legionella sainthelensi]|uniref:response regulator n=1 Tax=Legionella sainthelensi TaxID=28087 RepID=UPI000F6BCF73|nr:response regulator [Legionella sainthelensi]VEB35984.1 two component system DNA-binding response regulator [Legionella sainthelensi]